MDLWYNQTMTINAHGPEPFSSKWNIAMHGYTSTIPNTTVSTGNFDQFLRYHRWVTNPKYWSNPSLLSSFFPTRNHFWPGQEMSSDRIYKQFMIVVGYNLRLATSNYQRSNPTNRMRANFNEFPPFQLLTTASTCCSVTRLCCASASCFLRICQQPSSAMSPCYNCNITRQSSLNQHAPRIPG